MSIRDRKLLKAINVLTICLIASLCVYMAAGVWNIVLFSITVTKETFERAPYVIFAIVIFMILLPIISLLKYISFYKTIKKSGITFKKNNRSDNSFWAKFKSEGAQPQTVLLHDFISYICFAVSLETCINVEGVIIYGVWLFFVIRPYMFIVCYLVIFILILNMDEPREKRRQKRLKKETEQRKIAEEQKQARLKREAQQRIAFCVQLLSTAGMRFFIKYFNYLKSWNVPDILDIIEEDYREQDKRQRIEAAQKIFQNNLQRTALVIISHSSKIDEETKNKAEELIE